MDSATDGLSVTCRASSGVAETLEDAVGIDHAAHPRTPGLRFPRPSTTTALAKPRFRARSATAIPLTAACRTAP